MRVALRKQVLFQKKNFMSMKTKVAILVSSFAVLLFVVVGSFGGVHASSNDGSYRQMQVYSEVLSRVQNEYVEDPNIPKVTDGALHGLVESLDANSSYLSAEEYKHYKSMKTGGNADIGATVSKRFGYAAVVAVIPGGPAEKAGVENTDIIESIESGRPPTVGGEDGLRSVQLIEAIYQSSAANAPVTIAAEYD